MELDPGNIVFAVLTVFVTVVFVQCIRAFGNLPLGLIGLELNLLAYGFLWDTAAKALRGAPYWSRFQPVGHIFSGKYPVYFNKGTTLFLLAFFNLLIMGMNMKLNDHLESALTSKSAGEGASKGRKYVLRILTVFLGVLSMFIYILVQAVWEGKS